ncbi:T9SS type A sorting domain-containing protein [Rufibacter sp. LB8]|uniref:T9SS type A sorting domain-containing protein n=1 Tax=Rufibacter sp. LB8 TaxID=2777781 RepID=UPI00178C7680|nr:T9SS type A sorting domain-containing protein [Rufibacter sp. LB8]
MIQKATRTLGSTFLATLLLGLGTQSFAQEKATVEKHARQSKIKIIQAEGDVHYLLDTTFTLKEGQTIAQAVKEMKEKAGSLKNLGAKVILPTKVNSLSQTEFVNVFPSRVGDTVNVAVLRFAGRDSLFRQLHRTRVYTRDSAQTLFHGDLKEVRVTGARALGKEGIRIFTRDLAEGDSLQKRRVIFRMDTTFTTNMDSIKIQNIESIRVLRNGARVQAKLLEAAGNIRVTEPGNVEVISLTTKEGKTIILLKPSKALAAKTDKKNQKAAKKKEGQTDVLVAPNPSNGKFRLSFNVPAASEVKVRIVNNAGKTVFQDEPGKVSGFYAKDIDLSKAGAGLYVIQLMIGNKVQSEKILVQ